MIPQLQNNIQSLETTTLHLSPKISIMEPLGYAPAREEFCEPKMAPLVPLCLQPPPSNSSKLHSHRGRKSVSAWDPAAQLHEVDPDLATSSARTTERKT